MKAARAYNGVEGSLVWNEVELILYYRDVDRAEGKRQIVCAYCGQKHRAPFKPQLDWYFNHPCLGSEAVAA